MPYPTPTLTDLIALALADITGSELDGADGLLPISNLVIMAMLQGRLAYDHYGYLARVAKNSTPFYAEDAWLDAWANLKGVYRKDATAAGTGNAAPGSAQFTGSQVGADIPAGTVLRRGDGFEYVTTQDAVLGSGNTVTVNFAALATGSAGNAAAGVQLTIANPIAGINSAGQSTTLVTGGADQELSDDLRTRMFGVYSAPSAGGDQADYVNWALAVPGVTRAWCNPVGAGAGTVVVYVMLDDAEAEYNGFPQGNGGVAAAETRAAQATGDQLTVANAIYPLRPVTALVFVEAPIAQPVPFTFAALAPNTTPIQAAIETAIASMFLRKGSALGSTIYQSDWDAAISAVPGIQEFAVSTPATAVAVPLGYLPTLGAITWPG